MKAIGLWLGMSVALLAGRVVAEAVAVPAEVAVESPHFVSCTAFRQGTRLRLVPNQVAVQAKSLTLPRLCGVLRSVHWAGGSEDTITVEPLPDRWLVHWKAAPAEKTELVLEFDRPPLLPAEVGPVQPGADGSLLLPACLATTHGTKLRFEPQPFKNTVGYWTQVDDSASWDVTLAKPGRYAVAVLQGCGKGQGGSDAVLTVTRADEVAATLAFSPVETGHFQNFRWVQLGFVTVESPGDYEVRVAPQRIQKAALCDIRAVSLVPQATAR